MVDNIDTKLARLFQYQRFAMYAVIMFLIVYLLFIRIKPSYSGAVSRHPKIIHLIVILEFRS